MITLHNFCYNKSNVKQGRRLKILTRWNDKVTYFVLFCSIVLSFIFIFVVYILTFIDYTSFFDKVVQCSVNQDFNCLLLTLAERESTFEHIEVFVSLNLSIIALFLSTISMTIYKFRLEKK